jgi:hypothetical protein
MQLTRHERSDYYATAAPSGLTYRMRATTAGRCPAATNSRVGDALAHSYALKPFPRISSSYVWISSRLVGELAA